MPSEPAQVSPIKPVAHIYGVPVVVGGLDNVSAGSSCSRRYSPSLAWCGLYFPDNSCLLYYGSYVP